MFEQYHPETCVQCKSCTKVCPSARNGGVVPHEVVSAVNTGMGPKDIWKCLQCHRCSDACPKEIQVSEIILGLRNLSDEKPERFVKSRSTVLSFGRTVPPSKMSSSLREQLGLGQDQVSPETIMKIRGDSE